MAKLVCATTLYSCGLACIESILSDNGIQKTQGQLIADLAHLFPPWQTHPGLMSLGDAETIFREAGLQVAMSLAATSQEAILLLKAADTVGAILFTTKFWEDPQTRIGLCDLKHCLRVSDADGVGVTVMHPYRCPSTAKAESYTWQEVISFEGFLAIFRK
jgi:hypothetical protein